MRRSLAVEQIGAGLDVLAGTDVVALHDAALREELLALTNLTNRLHAELVRRVDVFDRRGLSEPDGFRTVKGWLQGFGQMPAVVAHRLVKAARLLRRLPTLTSAVQSGEVSAEHVQQVARLADQVSVERVAEAEPILADAATALDLPRFITVCERVRAHVDPDGPDPAKAFDQRTLSVTPVQGAVVVRGQLDPEGGAALLTALDAVMTPPADGDDRTAGQRRADALVELARRPLAAGSLPTVGGQRPQVGVLLYPQALSPATLRELAQAQQTGATGRRLREFLAERESAGQPALGKDRTRPDLADDRDEVPASAAKVRASATRLPASAANRIHDGMLADPPDNPPDKPPNNRRGNRPGNRPDPPPEPTTDPPLLPLAEQPDWSQPGWSDPPWLNWVGPIHPATAQRIACDGDIWRIVLDPTTGMPLDVGRAHRLVPHWIRRALHARDRGCRWPGCDVPSQWTDAHHCLPWTDGGETNVTGCVLLCRHHHGLVHEGGWSIDFDATTGRIHITRPGGIPYLIPRAHWSSWNGPTSQAA